ncbi:PREDICTED: Meckel syndrome type 1 protein-like [Acropora digitifera]|uniref:Meckel syndrome type 1 protein-like n=1 Tax=Acropora digitifera TaxID=70779 RepID=UPI00077B182A|nr:PREDICTED: Meckel syndrome type 1 protein-like [Acropora digitifera]
MSSVRRRNISTKADQRKRPGGFAPRLNPITIHETKTSKTTAHVLNIPYKTMHIMADLAPAGKAIVDQEDEYVLFSVKIDAYGQIFVKPDFNGDNPPYRLETCNELREVYEYTVEHCSQQMTSDQREQEFKSFTELYNRHAFYLASQVGPGFDPLVRSVLDFMCHNLHYLKWRPADDPVLSGVTQTCVTKLEGEDYVAHFSYPFEFSLVFQEDEDSADDFIHWPTLFMEVLSLDSWKRFRTEGYSYLTIPNKAVFVIAEWRPADDPVLSGVTQTCVTKLEGEDYVAHFSYPFEFSLVFQEDDDSADDFIHWPTLFMEVLSLDSWKRFRTEGYSYLTIPNKAGKTESVELFGHSSFLISLAFLPLISFTLNESIEVNIVKFVIETEKKRTVLVFILCCIFAFGLQDKVLSKYFFRTASSGSVTVRLHILQQCQSFMEVAKKPRRTRTILDRIG